VDLGHAVYIRLGEIGCLQLASLGRRPVPGGGSSPRNPDLSSATRERHDSGEEEVAAVDPGPGQLRSSSPHGALTRRFTGTRPFCESMTYIFTLGNVFSMASM
jgi:hypothetical protein